MGKRRKAGYHQYKWRLYADHNVEGQMVRVLRAQKMDVLYVNEKPALKKQRDDTRFHARRARELGRYVLTRDEDFWSDRILPLHESPGVIVVRVADPREAAYAVVVLRNIFRLFKRVLHEPHYLDKLKVKLTDDGVQVRFLDEGTQRKRTESFPWTDWM